MDIKIRKAKKKEIEWINERYDEVQFVHSNFENEVIAIAEVNQEKAGLGRLVTINDATLELGGMYVFSSFRRQGVASKIVDFLPKCVPPQHTTYCIPFVKLSHFYEQFGFWCCLPSTQIPEPILKKFKWCEQHYSEGVTLLARPKL